MERNIRLATGLTLFAHAACHFASHAAGLFRRDAMDAAGRNALLAPWQGWAGRIALLGSLLVHGGLGLRALHRRRLRIPTGGSRGIDPSWFAVFGNSVYFQEADRAGRGFCRPLHALRRAFRVQCRFGIGGRRRPLPVRWHGRRHQAGITPTGSGPLLHYVAYGQNEGRSPLG